MALASMSWLCLGAGFHVSTGPLKIPLAHHYLLIMEQEAAVVHVHNY